MTDKPAKIIMVHQGPFDSLICDAGTFLMVAAVMLVGVCLKSDAMQWVGSFMILVMLTRRGSPHIKKMTPEEAANYLRDTFDATADRVAR